VEVSRPSHPSSLTKPLTFAADGGGRVMDAERVALLCPLCVAPGQWDRRCLRAARRPAAAIPRARPGRRAQCRRGQSRLCCPSF